MMMSKRNFRRLLIALAFVAITIRNWHDEDLLWSSLSASSKSGAARTKVDSSIDSGPITTVAYAISITHCGPNFNPFDDAAILKRSIELNSWPRHPQSRYGAKFYAFVHTSNATSYNYLLDRCGSRLSLAGWDTILPQEDQIHRNLIMKPPGSILKYNILDDGCCGDVELIKLATWTLTSHHIAVHLDLDTLVTHPFDEIFDVMHYRYDTDEGRRARSRLVEVVAPTDLNRRSTGDPSKSSTISAQELLSNITVNAYYTRDYNMINPHKRGNVQHVGVQGGFLVVRPSWSTYRNLLDMVYSGEFYGGFEGVDTGWFKSGFGRHIWGSMTVQGLLAYYFTNVDLEHSIELNRCWYNNIADNSHVSTRTRNPKFPWGSLIAQVRNASNPRYNYHDEKCRDGRSNCDDVDCQRFPVKQTRMIHYTYCKAPSQCGHCDYMETYKEVTCYSFIKEWFRVRSTLPGEIIPHMEDNAFVNNVQMMKEDGTVDVHQGNCYKEFTLGYCQGAGKYVSMKQRNISLMEGN